MNVIMPGALTQDQPQVPLGGDQPPVQALAAGAGNHLSAIAFACGAWAGVLMISTVTAANTASYAAG